MKAKIYYSPIAVRDLERVWDEVFEASQNFDVADRYIDDLMEKAAAKAAFPKSGSPLYYEESFTGYYFIVFKAYLLFYHCDESGMFIDRVHGQATAF